MISKIDTFNVMGDNRGKLVALEANRQIPFTIKRVFYIYGTNEDMPRGKHSHYKTKQYLIALKGSCKIILDDGVNKQILELNQPNQGLFQDALVWSEMKDFSEDCVLMVIASEYYDESDYIRNYDKFIKEVKNV